MTNKPLPQASKTPTGHWGFFKQLVLLEEQAAHETKYNAPEGVKIFSYDEAPELLKQKYMTLITNHNSLADAHKKNCVDTHIILVEKTPEEALAFTHAFVDKTKAAHTHTIIIAKPNTELTIIEKCSGTSAQVNHFVEIFLEENSSVNYADIQEINGTYLSEKKALLARDARMTWLDVNASAEQTYSRVSSVLRGEGASTTNNSIFLGKKQAMIDYRGDAYHEAKYTSSRLLTKGLLNDEAKAIYEGQLNIGSEAPKSDAFQQEDCLLLSEHAEIKASPQLYINNNDVQCSHAATTSKPEKKLLFYLMSRGLNKQEAQKILLKAHVWPSIEALPQALQKIVAPEMTRLLEVFS